MPKIAVFDVGNILIRWDQRNLYQKIFGDRRQMEHFLAEVCTNAWNLEQDRGRSWADGEREAIARHPEFEAEIRAFRARWWETLHGPIAEHVALLDALQRNGVPTYAITNFAADTFEETCAAFPFMQRFNGVICSGREGVCKPNPAIYRLLLERFGLNAGDCVFIDDSAANIAAADALGFHTIHYTIGLDSAGAFRQFGFPVG